MRQRSILPKRLYSIGILLWEKEEEPEKNVLLKCVVIISLIVCNKSESMGAPGRCATCYLSDFDETWPV